MHFRGLIFAEGVLRTMFNLPAGSQVLNARCEGAAEAIQFDLIKLFNLRPCIHVRCAVKNL